METPPVLVERVKFSMLFNGGVILDDGRKIAIGETFGVALSISVPFLSMRLKPNGFPRIRLPVFRGASKSILTVKFTLTVR